MRVFGVDVAVELGAIGVLPGERVLDLRTSAGGSVLAVDRRADGWLLDAPGEGRHLVAPDGTRVTTGHEDVDGGRLLVAQSLPTAAALQGRDLFHASAVRTPSGVVAFSGPSGSGKSTLARAFAAAGRGTGFTDDVLAVGADTTSVVAYAGPTVGDDPASVPTGGPIHVRSLVLLDRVAAPGAVHVAEPDPDRLLHELLAAAYVGHIAPRSRLLQRLEVCSQLLAHRRVHRLVVPRGATVAATLQHLFSADGIIPGGGVV